MAKAKPFTWTVSFTVAPLWVQDGFTLSDERALSMLASEIGTAAEGELSAKVLVAPSPADIAKAQGYQKDSMGHIAAVREFREGAPHEGVVASALTQARRLLDSVAFVANEGDTAPILARIDEALALINTRQGAAVAIEA